MKTLLTAAALLALAGPVAAQTAPAPMPPQPPLQTQRLSTNVNVVIGDGGNILVLNGPEGLLLVDAELPQGAPRVMTAVAAIDPSPLRFVIDTHWHIDHTGGNRYMTGQGAIVIGHDAVRTRRMTAQTLRIYDATIPAARHPHSLPILTFDSTMTLHINGQTVRPSMCPARIPTATYWCISSSQT